MQEPPLTVCDGSGIIRDYWLDEPDFVLCPGCENCEPKSPMPAVVPFRQTTLFEIIAGKDD